MDDKVIAVIDGNSLMHRAFHAVQAPMNAPDGRPTNACFGFMSMLLKLITDFKPAGIICAFDAGIPVERFEAIEQYKAQRPPTDPDLKVQFPMIEELLTSLNIPVVRVQDYEGDDILGTVSAQAEAKGGIKTLLISGDKDVLQLASDKTIIVTNKTGMSDVKIYDPEGVIERFGVDAAHVPDYLGLMGDSSDNIPGIAGVGPKTATKLLQDYGDIEGVIAHAGELKGKLAEKVAQGAQLALDSRKVATIIRDVPLELSFDEVVFPSFDAEKVKAAFGELGMMSQLRKVLKVSGEDASESSMDTALAAHTASRRAAEGGGEAAGKGEEREAAFLLSMQKIIECSNAQDAFEDIVKKQAPVALYLDDPTAQQSSKTKKAQQSLLFDDELEEEQATLYLAQADCVLSLSGEALSQLLSLLLLSSLEVITYDLKSLLRVLAPADSSEQAYISEAELLSIRAFDLCVAGYLLDSDKASNDPHDFINRYLIGLDISKYQEDEHNPSSYGAAIAASALCIAPAIKEALQSTGSQQCFEEIEQALTPVLASIERKGVLVDTEVLAEQGRALSGRIEELRTEAYALADEEFNLDSPKQVGEILFEKLMLPPKKKTKSGYSTDASVLSELTGLSPLPGIILEYRELAKLRSTYIDALPKLKREDGRIHTTFNQTVAATGRLSSSDPNLQNIPVRSDLGRRIRTAFVADAAALGVKEAVFVSADYSQIELRLLAHLSEDQHLIDAFIHGEDFHKETAARVFGVAAAEVTPEMRSKAKAVNFGIVYGQQAFGLAQSLGIEFSEAAEMIERYFEAYPQVKTYLESLKMQAKEQGWVDTIFGRRRQISEVSSTNPNRRGFAERTAMNHPMQGSAADIIKLAMNRVAKRLCADGYRSQMVLQVHDELDFNCDVAELDSLSAMVTELMQNVVELRVPLVVDVSSGPNWAVAH